MTLGEWRNAMIICPMGHHFGPTALFRRPRFDDRQDTSRFCGSQMPLLVVTERAKVTTSPRSSTFPWPLVANTMAPTQIWSFSSAHRDGTVGRVASETTAATSCRSSLGVVERLLDSEKAVRWIAPRRPANYPPSLESSAMYASGSRAGETFTTSDVRQEGRHHSGSRPDVCPAKHAPMSESTKSAQRHTMSCDRQKRPLDHQYARFRRLPRFRSGRDLTWGRCSDPQRMRRLVPSPLNSRGQFEHAHHAKSSHRFVLHRAYASPKLVNAASDIGRDSGHDAPNSWPWLPRPGD